MNLFTPAETTANYAVAGAGKTRLPVGKMLVLGTLAGFLIAMGAVAANTAAHGLQDAGLTKLVSGLLFPFGLVMVILSGAELFTGNTLISISVLARQATLKGMLRNWFYVYLGNGLGAFLAAAGCAFLGQLNCGDGALAVYTIKVAAAKCSLSWFNAVGLGFFCNVLVTLGVLLSLGAKDTVGRFLGAYLPVAFFVIAGFEHSIANLFYVPAGLLAAERPVYAALALTRGLNLSGLTWSNFWLHNLLPVTLGNILGGLAVGSLYWYCYGRREQQL